MWSLWRTAQENHSRPSDLLDIEDRLVAYLLDSAVSMFGRILENALQERVNVGSSSHQNWTNKYEIEQLLSPNFKFPAPTRKSSGISSSGGGDVGGGLATIMMLAGQRNSGVKKWAYKEN